jgi:hypothetical protein
MPRWRSTSAAQGSDSLYPQLARMMGGDVTVASELGKGSVFTVRSLRRRRGQSEQSPDGNPGPKPHSNDLFRKRPYFFLGLVAEW